MLVVALAGRSGAGKDAVADMLVRRLGPGFVNLKLSQPLKDAACALFGLPRACVEDAALKDTPHPALDGSTPRALLQWLGTDVMQHGLAGSGLVPSVGRGLFARRILEAIDALPPPTRGVVISDVRFQHELELLRERHPALLAIRIVRPGTFKRDHAHIHAHESERAVDSLALDPGSLVELRNDGTLDQLEAAVARLVCRQTRAHEE
jgi:hypothetical protein